MELSNNNDNLPTLSEREIGFLDNLALGLPINKAAINAGYSKSYANKGIYTELCKPYWIQRIQTYAQSFPEARQTLARLRLPRLFRLEEKALAKAEKNPLLLYKYPKLAEREYQLAGLASGDESPVAPRINIQEVRNLMIQVVANSPGRMEKCIKLPDSTDQVVGIDCEISAKKGVVKRKTGDMSND